METKHLTFFTLLFGLFAVCINQSQCTPVTGQLVDQVNLEPTHFTIESPNKDNNRGGRQYFAGYPDGRSSAYNSGYGAATNGSDRS